MGVAIKKQDEEDFCGNKIVPYLDCGDAYTNPYM